MLFSIELRADSVSCIVDLIFLKSLGCFSLKRLQQRALAQLSKLKRWQWILPLSAFLSVLTVWSIYKTEFLAGFWGLLDDEIAIVTTENGEDDRPNLTITDPSKSFWDVLELLGVPLALAILGAWFQKTQHQLRRHRHQW